MEAMLNNLSNVYKKPWNGIPDDVQIELRTPHGMLGNEERNCLYWLSRELYGGEGVIVDAGSYIGSSAFCLARGLEDSRVFDHKSSNAVIHTYDFFAAYDQYVIDSISEEIRPISYGESYLDIFQQQTSKYKEMIKVHAGDFMEKSPPNESIEILFVDIAKNNSLNSRLVEKYFPKLIPGKGILMHQDYYHVWHPAIHVTMQFLKKYFDVLDPHIQHQSRLYRLTSPIDPADLKIAAEYKFSLEEKIALLEAASSEETVEPIKRMLDLVMILEVINAGDLASFARLRKEFQIRNPELQTSYELWATQSRALDDYAINKFNLSII